MRREAIKQKTAKDLLARESIIGEPAKEAYLHRIRPDKVIKQWYRPRDRMENRWEEGIMFNTKDGEDRKMEWANRVRRLTSLMNDGNTKEFYKEVNRLTKIKVGFPPVKGLIEEGGKIILEEDEVNKKISEHYENIFLKDEED